MRKGKILQVSVFLSCCCLNSFAYNISYIGIEAAITIAVLFLPVVYQTIYRLKGKFRQNEEVNLIHS